MPATEKRFPQAIFEDLPSFCIVLQWEWDFKLGDAFLPTAIKIKSEELFSNLLAIFWSDAPAVLKCTLERSEQPHFSRKGSYFKQLLSFPFIYHMIATYHVEFLWVNC